VSDFRDTGRTGIAVAAIKQACEGLYFGGNDPEVGGYSPFATVLVLGVYHVVAKSTGERGMRAACALQTNVEFPEARRETIRKLREVLGDLESIEATSQQVPT